MAHHHLTLGKASPDVSRKSSHQAGLGWIMVLLVALAASVGFTLDHLVAIAP
jgi:hypothetical protein